MGAIKETAIAAKETVRATHRTARGTTDWPFALFFGPLLDLRLRRAASETGLNPTHAAVRRRLEASTWARWLSTIIYISIIAVTIWLCGWSFAPLIPLAWAILARRAAWWRGQPTLRRMLSPGAWVVMGLSLIPVAVFFFGALFEPLDGEVRGWLTHGAGWAAASVAFISALAVAERLKRPEPAAEGRTPDAEFMASLVGMTGTALDAAIERGEFAVGRSGEQLHAVYPLGFEGRMSRDAIETALRERSAPWEVAALDYSERRLTLEPTAEGTQRKREALALSGGLVDDLLDEHDGGQPSVGLDWGRFN